MKQVAVLSDIHGNSWALEAVLEDMAKYQIDTILNLGDILYGPLDPAGTYELLHQIDQVAVQGNQDRIMIEGNEPDNPTLDFVLKSLDHEAMDWLRHLPQTATVDDQLFLCHGTPEDDSVYLVEYIESGFPVIRSDEALKVFISGIDAAVILCGHSHMRQWIRLSDGRFILNPGSVGLPAYDDEHPAYHKMQSGSPFASYAILTMDDGQPSIEWKLIPYDWQAAVRAARRNNREDWAEWLETGRA